MFGGFVHWKTPKPTDNSTVVQLHPHTHWPELRVLICVINVDKKTVGSTVAMRTTMQSSCLFREARKTAVAERLPLFIKALQRCDFSALAELTMRESNALHAACLDSWPPAIFLNETSFAVMQFVHIVNQHCGRTVLAYTFDAGPNAFLLVLKDDVAWVLALLTARFGDKKLGNRTELNISPRQPDGDDLRVAKLRRVEQHLSTESTTTTTVGHTLEIRGLQYPTVQLSSKEDEVLLERLPLQPGSIRYIISTQVGPGPHS
uniref:Diphosphomevalonate decarboxylase n=2 Tax=Schistocephalus solidus TaxID=70667 RepID=A0A0X3PZJ4_SCHSO